MVGYPENYQKHTPKKIIDESKTWWKMPALYEISIVYTWSKWNPTVLDRSGMAHAHLVNAYYGSAQTKSSSQQRLYSTFYDLHQSSSSANYGGIGAVIAMKLHAFDTNGAPLMSTVAEDHGSHYEVFTARTQKVIDQFKGQDSRLRSTGNWTVSENVVTRRYRCSPWSSEERVKILSRRILHQLCSHSAWKLGQSTCNSRKCRCPRTRKLQTMSNTKLWRILWNLWCQRSCY